MNLIAKAAELVETIAGERLCRLMGHRWGIAPALRAGGHVYGPYKVCGCCNLQADLPTAPPSDHPETMAYDPHTPEAEWLRSIEPEIFTGGTP